MPTDGEEPTAFIGRVAGLGLADGCECFKDNSISRRWGNDDVVGGGCVGWGGGGA